MIRSASGSAAVSSALAGSLFRHSREGIFTLNRNLQITQWNPAMARLTDYPEADLLGRELRDFLPTLLPQDSGQLAAFQKGSEITLPVLSLPNHTDGHITLCEAEYLPLFAEDGKPEGFLCFVRPLASQPQPAPEPVTLIDHPVAVLGESWPDAALSMQKLVDAAPCIITVYDLVEGRHLYFNQQMEEQLGLSLADIQGLGSQVFAQLIHPDDISRLIAHIGLVAQSEDGVITELEYRIKSRRGKWHSFQVRGSVFQRDAQGRATQALVMFTENSESRKNRELVEGIISSSLSAIMAFEPVYNPSGKIIDFRYSLMNSQAEILTGRPKSYFLGKLLKRNLEATNALDRFERYVQVVETGVPAQFESVFETPAWSGWVHIAAAKMGNGLALTFKDITARKKAERELAESRDFIQKITDTAPFVISVFDLDLGKYTFINRQLAETAGYTLADIAEMSSEELVMLLHPEDAARLPEHYARLYALPDGSEVELEFRLRNKAGFYQWMVARDTVFRRHPDGRLSAVLGFTHDITNIKKSKDLLDSVLDSSLMGITAYESIRNEQGKLVDFRFLLANAQSEKFLGKTSEELAGKRMTELYPGIRAQGLFDKFRETVETGKPLQVEQNYQLTNGEWQWLHITAVKMEDGLTITWNNISEQKQAEERLRQSETLLQEAQQLARIGVWEWDIKRDKVNWTDNLYEQYGFRPGEIDINYEQYLALLEPEDRETIKSLHQRTFETREPFLFTHRIFTANKEIRHLVARGQLITDDNGEPARLVGTTMDITELITMQEELANMEHLRQLGEAIPQIVWMADEKGRTTYANRQWFTYTGVPETEITDETWIDIIHPEDRTRCDHSWKTAIRAKAAYQIEFRMRRKDGRYHWHLGRAVPVVDELGQLTRWFGTCTDIEYQKRAQQQLKASVEQFRFLAESIPQMVWTADPDGKTDYFNQRWYSYTGLSEKASLGANWVNALHEKDVEASKMRWTRSVLSGEPYNIEYRLRQANGSYRWFLGRGVAQKDAAGRVERWFGTCTDIHDQKMAMEELGAVKDTLALYNRELTATNDALRHTNADLDNFIYTASHDLKAPISNIEGLVAVLMAELDPKNRTTAEVLRHMQDSVSRFKQTLRDLSDITKTERRSQPDPVVVLPELWEEVCSDVKALREQVNARITEKWGVTHHAFSRKNLRSILYNLLSNALKYHDPQRPLHILVSTATDDGWLKLEVRDNGLGIEAAQLSRVFEMFKRSHTHVEGSGIGLYIVKRIIENAGGSIEVSSCPGEGTTFTLRLPLPGRES